MTSVQIMLLFPTVTRVMQIFEGIPIYCLHFVGAAGMAATYKYTTKSRSEWKIKRREWKELDKDNKSVHKNTESEGLLEPKLYSENVGRGEISKKKVGGGRKRKSMGGKACF